jgi:flagella basal body P-ring formation protein FlgA
VRKAFMPFLSSSIDSENITVVGGYTVFLPDSLPAEEKPLYRALFEQLKEKTTFPVTRIEASIQDVNRYGYGLSKNTGEVFRVVPLDAGNRTTESSEHPPGPLYIQAEVTAYAVCAVTAVPLRWGDPLNSATVEFREVEVPIGKLDSLIAESFPINVYEMRTSKNPGDIIFSSDIKKVTMVRAGKPITIHYARNTIRLILRGKAYTSGGFQEIVTIQPENSTKKLDAEVVGYSEVRIEVR